jgi:hypothetical protein
VGGPGTAAALKLLATPNAFDRHPLGGVFEVYISQEAPWEDRYDMLDPQWDTHPYTLDEYEENLKDLVRRVQADEFPASKAITPDEAEELFSLIALLRSRGAVRGSRT